VATLLLLLLLVARGARARTEDALTAAKVVGIVDEDDAVDDDDVDGCIRTARWFC
jgi:hypothetical protein